MSDEHERLLRKVMICKPEDYEPWGELKRWGKPDDRHADCSTGCKFARWLEDVKIEGDQHYLSMDWCVCTNSLGATARPRRPCGSKSHEG
ncbi:MAG TPA: hypothetical protein VE967_19575 [Gemmatimonadaceae bacterium]|nr:hypothetical protein [Gemmatimonadaceae bacterium]